MPLSNNSIVIRRRSKGCGIGSSLGYYAMYFGVSIVVAVVISICLIISCLYIPEIRQSIDMGNGSELASIILDKFSDWIFGIVAISNVTSFFMFWCIYKAQKRHFLHELYFARTSVSYIVFVALLGFCLNICISMFFTLIDPLLPSFNTYTPELEKAMSEVSWVTVITAVFLAPIFEETLFRGIILQRLETCFNIRTAVILSALLFGIAHGSLYQGSYAFVLGIILGWVYVRTRSIYVPMTMHMAFNSGAYTCQLLGDISNTCVFGIFLLTLAISVLLIFYLKKRLPEYNVTYETPEYTQENFQPE